MYIVKSNAIAVLRNHGFPRVTALWVSKRLVPWSVCSAFCSESWKIVPAPWCCVSSSVLLSPHTHAFSFSFHLAVALRQHNSCSNWEHPLGGPRLPQWEPSVVSPGAPAWPHRSSSDGGVCYAGTCCNECLLLSFFVSFLDKRIPSHNSVTITKHKHAQFWSSASLNNF